MNDDISTVIDGLRATAREFGNDHGILYYSAPDETSYRGYRDLDENARRISHSLTKHGLVPGSTVVIGLSDALQVADAAFGAMYTGIAFVPAPVAGFGAGAQLGHSVTGLVKASEASAVLVDAAVLERLGASKDSLGASVLVLEDLLAEGDPDAWTEPAIDGDTIAYLMFTSGSTGDPKGVICTHRGVIETAWATEQLFSNNSDATVVGWAPMHHVMGLGLQAIFPAITGAKVVVCSTALFQKRPIFWLQLISRHRGTMSAAGNFAFDLVTQLATDEQIADLDLSSLVSLLSGSEPVRPASVHAFLARFASTGVTASMIAPAMGMTEAMLIACKFPGEQLTIRRFDKTELERGHLEPAGPDADPRASVEYVSCGRWTDRTSLVIVDPDTLQPVADGQVGEIWIDSPMVSPGYFRRPDATAETFGRSIEGSDRSYMRTGDLAAVLDGQLYVTGRLKEMLILRGRNVYPQDIEAAARLISPAVGIGAVFELHGHPSAIGIAFEYSEDALAESGETLPSLAAKVHDALVTGHSLPSLAVGIVSEGSLPRTPTGKVRRQPTRQQLEAGSLAAVHSSGFAPGAVTTS
ncbi:AMP-binding protein [Herbiconiux daphne]|uniref:AMP-binding protein n=1 Tax=Herbiconiux daphne TaxID=2970914 RepID=A0ABT2GZJ1_9MICO|nr:AMP-binding protein [Herbiconiux daphne]MCS5733380.1 AMP-binding protein [Herbiconiux daphne]